MAVRRLVAEVAYSDGHVEEAVISGKVQRYYEQQYKVSLTKLDDMAATRTLQLAWEALRLANGRVMKDFDSWVDDVDAVAIEERDLVRPTPGAPPGDSSPSSPSPPG